MNEKKQTILLVEDDRKLNEVHKMVLEVGGFEILTAETIQEAREQLAQNEPDIILLDVMLPDGNGFDFCLECRDKTDAHIIFLTGKTNKDDYMRGMTDGGDDYITKPFNPDMLFVKIKRVMQRRKPSGSIKPQDVLVKGSLTLDRLAGQALCSGNDLALTKIEFTFLYTLSLHEGEIIPSDNLYKKAWGQEMGDDKNALRSLASRLRPKIEPSGYTVRNVYAKGYVFELI
jgi:DNA-binding response OmpR family regulator